MTESRQCGKHLHTVDTNIETSQNITKSLRMSKFWDHFTLKNEDNKVQHVYFKAEVVYHNSMSTMNQHLN